MGFGAMRDLLWYFQGRVIPTFAVAVWRDGVSFAGYHEKLESAYLLGVHKHE